jgi:hypothetical protein
VATPTRAERQALELGYRTVQDVRLGYFRLRASQTQGGDIRRVLQLLESRNISFGSPEATWAIIAEMVRQTLAGLLQTERIHNFPGGTSQRTRREFPLTPSMVLLGRDDPFNADLGTTNVNGWAARLIGRFAPSFVDVIPELYRSEATPPGVRPPPMATPRVEVTLPTEQIAQAIGEQVSKLGEQLGEKVEAGLVTGFDKLTASLPVIFRAYGMAPGAAPAPRPSPTLIPPETPTVSQVPPAVPTEVPRTGVQQNLFGERAPRQRPAGATTGLAQQLEDKYRPLFLDDVIGNAANVAILRGAAMNNSFQKSYLVTGPPGIGKTSAVIAAIRDYLLERQAAVGTTLFNPKYSPESPTFGVDGAVLLYRNAFDVQRLGGVSKLLGDIGVFVRKLPYPGTRQFAVIDDVTKFNADQQKVLLPLTERFPKTTFFFIANDDNYLDAFEDRGTRLRWTTPTPEQIQLRLVEIIRNEDLPFPDPVDEARRITESVGMRRSFRQAIIRLASDVNEITGDGGG